ncbi:hypothetical protein IL306_006662 [Fusarium sp. DS 682]|nr:hypothetical protein IL306_006662 [Fusarium sp. DS 682]
MSAINTAKEAIGKKPEPLAETYGNLFYYLPVRPALGVHARPRPTKLRWVVEWFKEYFWSYEFRAALLVGHITHLGIQGRL